MEVTGQQNIIDLTEGSDEETGDLNDGLPSYRDQIGSIRLSTGEIPIYLQRVPDGQGGKVWKISNATVAKIPQMWEELGYNDIAIYFGKLLGSLAYMGIVLLATLPAAAASYAMGGVSLWTQVAPLYLLLALAAVHYTALSLFVSARATSSDRLSASASTPVTKP